MKKALLALTICATITPLLSSHALAASSKKKPKKAKQHHAVTYKDLIAEPDKKHECDDKASPSWLDGLSGTMALTTNYIFRGLTQTENLPAAQAGITYTFPFGLYLNAWGSNVKFLDPTGAQATIEMDSIIGMTGALFGEEFGYDINYSRYNYIRAQGSSYNELNTKFTYKFLQAGISYTGNYSGTHATGTYYNGGVNLDIPSRYVYFDGVTFQALMGHYSFAKLAGNSYNDYLIGVSKQLNKTYTITGQWTGTNGRTLNPPYDDNQIVGTVSAAF